MKNLLILLVVFTTYQIRAQEYYHPVVLSGSSLSGCLIGEMPESIVGFSYSGGNWMQIPIQIDEREIKDLSAAYGQYASAWFPVPIGVDVLFYNDPSTFIGVDSTDPTIDLNDELAFMWDDLGQEINVLSTPNGTLAGFCCELKVFHPLQPNDSAFIYLFKNDGSLQQDADIDYVDYNFQLQGGGSYPANYNIFNGPNPELTTINTDFYESNFSERWINDGLIIKKDSDSEDILDRHQSFFNPGTCRRTVETFSNGRGCFVTNKDGCIRAIRSYFGANSGPLTNRRNIFYLKKQEVETFLRVHKIPGIYDVYDFDSTAFGMTNYNNLNPSGSLLIDGSPEKYNTNDTINWELITSSGIGSIVFSHQLSGTFQDGPDGSLSYFWEDNTTAPTARCSEDSLSIGTTGGSVSFNQTPGNEICTDPIGDCGLSNPNYRTFEITRVIYLDTAELSVIKAQELDLIARYPFAAVQGNCSDNTTSIYENGDNNQSVYPNPFNGIINIYGNKLKSIELFSVIGSKIDVEINRINENRAFLKTDNLKSGVYFLRVNEIVSRIVKN